MHRKWLSLALFLAIVLAPAAVRAEKVLRVVPQCRPEDPRSLRDDGDDHADARPDGLGPAVRLEREARAEAADGRALRDFARQARLHLHLAARAQVSRWATGYHQGRHRLAETLDDARCAGPGDDPVRRGDESRE